MKRSGTLLLAALVLLLAGVTHAQQKPAPNAAAAARAATDDLLRQLADAQKWAGEQIWHVKEGVDAVPGLINELKDQNNARQEEVQKLRDEVKGLYVETSSLRQQLDELKGDIGGVNANVSAFRTFSGFFIAVMILLLAVIFVMSIRR
jgi:peptidoglycan hydrolase CwlO-like protein